MDANETKGLKVTHPYVDAADARYQCEECGAWSASHDKGKGEILHSKRCDSKPQPASIANVVADRAASARRSDLQRFAARVRRTGITNGRDQDVRDAVAAGFLTQGDAMNTDD